MTPDRERQFLARHSAHDYRALVDTWRRLANYAKADCGLFAAAHHFPIFWLGKSGDARLPALYLSAGIHGDEPASVWGLVEWARTRLAKQRRTYLIFPCLNPWGLVNNRRDDGRGRDMNRGFTHPMPAIQRRWTRVLNTRMAGQKFHTAVCLHEDYDARGLYCYELYRRGQPSLANTAMAAAETVLPRDKRTSIEGSRAHNGLIRRNVLPEMPGAPEAFALFNDWAWQVHTFETPSEFSFYTRVQAHNYYLHAIENAIEACRT